TRRRLRSRRNFRLRLLTGVLGVCRIAFVDPLFWYGACHYMPPCGCLRSERTIERRRARRKDRKLLRPVVRRAIRTEYFPRVYISGPKLPCRRARDSSQPRFPRFEISPQTGAWRDCSHAPFFFRRRLIARDGASG